MLKSVRNLQFSPETCKKLRKFAVFLEKEAVFLFIKKIPALSQKIFYE
jgi:hypothetical protein